MQKAYAATEAASWEPAASSGLRPGGWARRHHCALGEMLVKLPREILTKTE